MTTFTVRPRPHDDGDIGYRRMGKSNLMHYFHTRQNMHIAISHCGIVAGRNDLMETGNADRCPYCMLIEDMRHAFDDDNQNGGSIAQKDI